MLIPHSIQKIDRMDIDISNLSKTRVNISRLKDCASRVLVRLNKENSNLSVVLADDMFVRKLNKKYRGHNSPTDVLAFSMLEGEHNSVDQTCCELGDVIISVQTAKKQAREYKHPLEKEIILLLIHGILHLLGFDHIKINDETEMKTLEKMFLKIIYPN